MNKNNEKRKQSYMRNSSVILNKYKKAALDKMVLTFQANQGIDVGVLYDLVELSRYRKTFFANLLNLSVKTIDRYKHDKKKLSPLNSEIVLKMIFLYGKGIEVFGSVDAFNNWLEKPTHYLGNNTPKSLLQTAGGVDLIYDELSRIEFGDLA
jgi:putative toxin-antitoxin system antitoxin component (TIGR02293 family)